MYYAKLLMEQVLVTMLSNNFIAHAKRVFISSTLYKFKCLHKLTKS